MRAELVVDRKEWNRRVHDVLLCRWHAKGHCDTQLAEIMQFPESSIQRNRQRLGLPANPKPQPPAYPHINTPPPKAKTNPIEFAKRMLGQRLKETPYDGYYLDSVPSNLDLFMQAANRVAKRSGLEQCTNCERWRQ